MTGRRPLDPAEAARISATYAVKVPETVQITRHAMGEGALWQDRHPREVAASNWRAMVRRNRVGAARPWRGE